jgi:predicted Rossmann fold flavoprotein
MSNSLVKLLPKSLIDVVLSVSKIPPTKNNCELSKVERNNLINTLKSFPLQIRSTRGFEEAIITSGGVSTKEINPKTMESKLVNGLYFAGEVIDVDAYTGGYNIQIALSTGYLAGINA